MAKVYVNKREDETSEAAVERAIKRFKKEVDKEGIIKECLDRQFYVTKSEKKKKQKKAAERKQRKQMYKERNLDRYYG